MAKSSVGTALNVTRTVTPISGGYSVVASGKTGSQHTSIGQGICDYIEITINEPYHLKFTTLQNNYMSFYVRSEGQDVYITPQVSGDPITVDLGIRSAETIYIGSRNYGSGGNINLSLTVDITK